VFTFAWRDRLGMLQSVGVSERESVHRRQATGLMRPF
jgi:hypothetical protein